jgi:hypothetical protein
VQSEQRATSESLDPPIFKIRKEIPAENIGGINSNSFQFAVIERLDYISQALYVLSKGGHAQAQLHPGKEAE